MSYATWEFMVISAHPEQLAADLLPDAYSLVDYDWRIVHANDKALRVFSLPLRYDGSTKLWDAVPDWIGSNTYYELHRAMADRSRVTLEDYWPAKDLWFRIDAAPTEIGMALFIRDIGVEKLLQQTVQDIEDRYRSTFDCAAVGIGHLALDGSWLRANRRLCDIVGYSHDELYLRTAHSITHPDDLGKELELFHGLLAREIDTYSIDKRFIGKSGAPVWVSVTVSIVEPPSGGARYLLAFVDETSERRQIEDDLRRQLVINRSITGSAAEGLFMLDSAGRITFLNPAAETLVGWTAQEIVGSPLHPKLLGRRPDDAAYPIDEFPFGEVLAAGASIRNHEDHFVRKDGTFVPVLCSAAPIIDPSGMIMGAVLAVRDESELKAAQTKLRSLYDREHRIAETLQRSLLLMPPRNAFAGLTVESRYAAAWDEAQVGGDFCDAVALGSDRVALVVGDVAGKGLAAAVRTAEIKFTLRTFLREEADPGKALERLNDFLVASREYEHESGRGDAHDDLDDHTIVSLTLVIMETKKGRMSFAIAGAEPAIILRVSGEREPAAATGLPLGAFAGAQYETCRRKIDHGDMVVMATDGLTEARRGHEFLGGDGLARLAADARNLPTIEAMALAVMTGAQDFTGGGLHDDACLLLARRD